MESYFEAISWALSLKATWKGMRFRSRDNYHLVDLLFKLESYKWKLYVTYFMIDHGLQVTHIQTFLLWPPLSDTGTLEIMFALNLFTQLCTFFSE